MNIVFGVSLQYEVFLALQTLIDPSARIHRHWRDQVAPALPPHFWEEMAELGSFSDLWAALPDVLPELAPDVGLEALLGTMREMPATDFAGRLLEGLIHDRQISEELAIGRSSLPDALARLPQVKREWLAFVGLFPLVPDSSAFLTLKLLVDDPERFRRHVLTILEAFWDADFHRTWQVLRPALMRSAAEKERLFASCDLAEFARQALLRIEVDDRNQTIRAARGGFEVAVTAIDTCFFFPSAFNDKRYWSAYENSPGRYRLYFPYFDPALSLDGDETTGQLAEPELDPALILKALGDSTRYAIASLLASEPRTAASLARILSLSKPTVSHHLGLMRTAGLLAERYRGGAIELGLNRQALESLSGLLVRHLFESPPSRPLVKSRSKK